VGFWEEEARGKDEAAVDGGGGWGGEGWDHVLRGRVRWQWLWMGYCGWLLLDGVYLERWEGRASTWMHACLEGEHPEKKAMDGFAADIERSIDPRYGL